MKKLLAVHSGGNGTVRVIAEQCEHGWQAYTEYDTIIIIRDQEGDIIYGDTISALIGLIRAVYPQWFRIFNWNGHMPIDQKGEE